MPVPDQVRDVISSWVESERRMESIVTPAELGESSTEELGSNLDL